MLGSDGSDGNDSRDVPARPLTRKLSIIVRGRREGQSSTLQGQGSGRLPDAARRYRAREFAKASKAFAEGWDLLFKPIRLGGELQLVIEPIAGKSPLDHGHRERASPGPGDRLQRLRLAKRDNLAGDDLAARFLVAESVGEITGQFVEVEFAPGMGEYEQVIGPDPVRRTISE